jgi:hypothetical protein
MHVVTAAGLRLRTSKFEVEMIWQHCHILPPDFGLAVSEVFKTLQECRSSAGRLVSFF